MTQTTFSNSPRTFVNVWNTSYCMLLGLGLLLYHCTVDVLFATSFSHLIARLCNGDMVSSQLIVWQAGVLCGWDYPASHSPVRLCNCLVSWVCPPLELELLTSFFISAGFSNDWFFFFFFGAAVAYCSAALVRLKHGKAAPTCTSVLAQGFFPVGRFSPPCYFKSAAECASLCTLCVWCVSAICGRSACG